MSASSKKISADCGRAMYSKKKKLLGMFFIEKLVTPLIAPLDPESYSEPFLGGFGSVYNSLPLLIENGIEDIQLSDKNPSLINAYKQVQKNPKQVQRHLASFELNYYRTHNKFYPTTKEEGKELFEKLHKEFTHLETKKRMNPKRAALFLYLIHNTQGGMLSFNMDTQTNRFTFCYCQNKLKQSVLYTSLF